jgi:DNA-binding transcriptional regulator YdaS (Cro superfamily)
MAIEPLKKAVQLLGGQTATAKAVGRGIVQAHVWKWLNSPNPDVMPPAEYCPAIERATGGAVRCEELRPDVEWSVLRRKCGDAIEEAA